jgi:transposase
MNTYKEIFGVDISKDVFDVHGIKSVHDQFKNNALGFKSFLKSLPKESVYS